MAAAASTSSRKRLARLLGAAILVVGVLLASFAYYLQTSRVAPGIEAGEGIPETFVIDRDGRIV
jgi:hypothetical protein